MGTHYEKLMQMFEKQGHFVETIPQLEKAVKESLQLTDSPTIINVMISPSAERKQQTFNWLTESKIPSK